VGAVVGVFVDSCAAVGGRTILGQGVWQQVSPQTSLKYISVLRTLKQQLSILHTAIESEAGQVTGDDDGDNVVGRAEGRIVGEVVTG